MIKTENLKRNSTLLLNNHVVKVMSISKGSLRVFDMTENQYVQYWFGIEQFKGKPITVADLIGLGFTVKRDFFYISISPKISIKIDITKTGFDVYINDCLLRQIRFVHQLEMILFGLKD